MISEDQLSALENWCNNVGHDTKVYAVKNVLELIAECRRYRAALVTIVKMEATGSTKIGLSEVARKALI